MITCHCPKCDATFRHENIEAVFCPHCQTTLCEKVGEDDGTSPAYHQQIHIPAGLVFATLVVAANAFIVSLLAIFTWASMENQSGRGLLLFTNGIFFSIPAISCFIKYWEFWWILAIAAVLGIGACIGPMCLGPLLA